MRFSLSTNTMRLYNGRRSVYAAVHLGRRSYFLSRWDTARVSPSGMNRRILHRGPVMTWYVGIFGA